MVRSLGADHVVDYTQEDFTRRGERHDLMLDIAGSRSFFELRRVLTPKATVVAVGAPMSNRGLGPLKHIVGTRLTSLGIFARRRCTGGGTPCAFAVSSDTPGRL